MKLHTLKPKKGSIHKGKPRLGRGQGSQKGGTAGKGTKGQQARSGYKKKFAFSSGWTPLVRAIGKFGFRSPNRKEWAILTTDLLQKIAQDHQLEKIDRAFLEKKRYVSKSKPSKILLGHKPLTQKICVEATAASKSANEAIKAAGGEIIFNQK